MSALRASRPARCCEHLTRCREAAACSRHCSSVRLLTLPILAVRPPSTIPILLQCVRNQSAHRLTVPSVWLCSASQLHSPPPPPPPRQALSQVQMRACTISDPIANTSTAAKCPLEALILHSALHVAWGLAVGPGRRALLARGLKATCRSVSIGSCMHQLEREKQREQESEREMRGERERGERREREAECEMGSAQRSDGNISCLLLGADIQRASGESVQSRFSRSRNETVCAPTLHNISRKLRTHTSQITSEYPRELKTCSRANNAASTQR